MLEIPTTQSLQAKLRQLREISDAAFSVKTNRLSPRAFRAGLTFVLSTVGAYIVPFFDFKFAFIAGVVAGVVAYRFGKRTTSWADELDLLLTQYEPYDQEAYAKLQERIKAYGGLDLAAISNWIQHEEKRIEVFLRIDNDSTGRRFMSKNISGGKTSTK